MANRIWRRRALRAAVILGAILVPQAARPFATVFQYHEGRVEAIVTAAYLPPDHDFNLVLRPDRDRPEAYKRFFEVFWRSGDHGLPRNTRWEKNIDGLLSGENEDAFGEGLWGDGFDPAVSETEARKDAGCKSCLAGAGACRPFAYEKEECRRLLGCERCVYRLSDNDPYNTAGVENIEMATYTGGAEVGLRGETRARLLRALTGSPFGDVMCDEFGQVPGDLCGRRVILGGPMALDESHLYKPEIHPIQTMLLDRGRVGTERSPNLVQQELDLFAFLDAYESVLAPDGEWFHKDRDYQSMWNDTQYPRVVTIDLAQEQRLIHPNPSDPAWVPYCTVSQREFSGGILDVAPRLFAEDQAFEEQRPCPNVTITFDKRPKGPGGIWIGKATFGWRKLDYRARFAAVTADKAPPEVRAAKTSKLPGTHRWYKYYVKVERNTKTTDFRLAPRPDTAEWGIFTPMHELGTEFNVWFPVSDANPQYQPVIEYSLLAPNTSAPVVTIRREVQLPRPGAMLAAGNRKTSIGAKGPVYDADVTASAQGLAGDPATWKYRFRRNGADIPDPPGHALHVHLEPGQSTAIEVTISDAQGVESARQALVLQAPSFVVDRAVEPVKEAGWYSPGKYYAPIATAAGPPAKDEPIAASIWKQLRLSAVAADEGEDFDRPAFPADYRVTLKYAWSNQFYRSRNTQWKWRAIPPAWMKPAADGRSVTVTPEDPTVATEVSAEVRVTDKFGRAAGVRVYGRTGQPTDIDAVKKLAASLWRWTEQDNVPFVQRRPPGTPPDALPATIVPSSAEPLNHALLAVALRARALRAGDEGAVPGLIEEIVRTGNDIYREHARRRGVAYTDPPRPPPASLSPTPSPADSDALRRMVIARSKHLRIGPGGIERNTPVIKRDDLPAPEPKPTTLPQRPR